MTKIIPIILLLSSVFIDFAEAGGAPNALSIASAVNYSNYIGFTNDEALLRGISYRRWFSNRTAVQVTLAEDGNNRFCAGLTGYYSYSRSTYTRLFGLSTLRYREQFGNKVTIGLGWGIEYYIGRLGQSITFHLSPNPGNLSFQVGSEFGIYFRF